jgi:hypothetical protein
MNLTAFIISICFIPFIPSVIIFCIVMIEITYKKIMRLIKY